MIEPREIRRATCPVCGRPDRILTKRGRINAHTDRRQPFTGNPYDQQCGASGMTVADAQKLGAS